MEKLEKVEYIIVHHSRRTYDCHTFIKIRHRFLRGWEDTGYHLLIGNKICGEGKISSGRSLEYQGAHAFGYNRNSIGVCVVGDYDKNEPTLKQFSALIELLKDLCKKYNVPYDNVIGHNEIPGCIKTCPGKNINMHDVRKFIKL